jgi:predicted phage tail component-like protein
MSYIETHGTLKDASFNGTDLSTKDYYIYDVIKPLLPKQKLLTIDIPKKSGLVISSKKFIQYEIVLKGFVEATNYTDLKSTLDALADFLYSDTDQQLIISDEDDRYWLCQYLDYEIIGERDNYVLVDLLFSCFDPFGYDTTPDSDDQTITVNDDTYVLANGGHFYALPVITITFNAAQSHIYVENNNITDNRFDISKSYAVNDELEVDCKNGTIKLNGSSSPAGFGDGGEGKAEWLMLAKGNNEIQVGTDDASIDIDINITFNKVYFY